MSTSHVTETEANEAAPAVAEVEDAAAAAHIDLSEIMGDDGSGLEFDSFRRAVKTKGLAFQLAAMDNALAVAMKHVRNAAYAHKLISAVAKKKIVAKAQRARQAQAAGKARGGGAAGTSAMMREFKVDPEVLRSLGATELGSITRPRLISLISTYANQHGLKKEENRRITVLDETLAGILKLEVGEEVAFTQFGKHLKAVLTDPA